MGKFLYRFIAITTLCVVTYNPLAQARAPENIQTAIQHVMAYYHSGAYFKDVQQVTSQGITYLKRRIEENKRAPTPKKLAVVFDIDETLLSNYQVIDAYLSQALPALAVLHNGKSYTFHYTTNLDAKAIPQTKHLYDLAKANQVAIFLVTGTTKKNEEFIIKKLLNSGYRDWQGLILKAENYRESSVIPFKTNARKQIAEQGYDIVLNMGDQDSDLQGGYADKTFKLPNPFYYIP